MQSLRLAYLRPTKRSRRTTQERAVAEHNPTKIWTASEYSADDVIKIMSKGNCVLIVPTLDSLAATKAERIRIIDEVLSKKSIIIDAKSNTEITINCKDQILSVLGMRQRDISAKDAKRSGRIGGQNGYTSKELNEWETLWASNATRAQIKEKCPISYETLWRWFTVERVIPVKRGRTAGRPSSRSTQEAEMRCQDCKQEPQHCRQCGCYLSSEQARARIDKMKAHQAEQDRLWMERWAWGDEG